MSMSESLMAAIADEDLIAECTRRGWTVNTPPGPGRWSFVGAPHGEAGGFVPDDEENSR